MNRIVSYTGEDYKNQETCDERQAMNDLVICNNLRDLTEDFTDTLRKLCIRARFLKMTGMIFAAGHYDDAQDLR